MLRNDYVANPDWFVPYIVDNVKYTFLDDFYCTSTVQNYVHNLSKSNTREVIVLKRTYCLASNGHVIKLHTQHLCLHLYICAPLKLYQRSFLLKCWWLPHTYLTVQSQDTKITA